jgi:predicted transposase/invertase (TIGR01784 family)
MFEEAVDMITEFTKEQKLRHAYDMRENHERIVQSYIHTGFLDGLEKGKQEGILTERREMARKLKAAGLPLEQIVGLTGLDAMEVDSL